MVWMIEEVMAVEELIEMDKNEWVWA